MRLEAPGLITYWKSRVIGVPEVRGQCLKRLEVEEALVEALRCMVEKGDRGSKVRDYL